MCCRKQVIVDYNTGVKTATFLFLYVWTIDLIYTYIIKSMVWTDKDVLKTSKNSCYMPSTLVFFMRSAVSHANK